MILRTFQVLFTSLLCFSAQQALAQVEQLPLDLQLENHDPPPSQLQVETTNLLQTIPAMEGDAEFGDQIIIERVSNWDPWQVQMLIAAYRSNNARLAPDNEESDSYLYYATTVNYTPNITDNLLLDIGFSEESYRYQNLSDLDFDYLRTHAGFFRYLPTGNSPLAYLFGNGFLFANYAYYRVTDGLFGPEAFTNHSAVFGFQKAIPIARGHQIYYGISSDLSFQANNPLFQRNEYRAYTGHAVEWTENLWTRVGYVASLFDYSQTNQQDWMHTIEANTNIVVARPHLFGQQAEIYLEGSLIFNLNNSNLDYIDYRYTNWGGGIGIRSNF